MLRQVQVELKVEVREQEVGRRQKGMREVLKGGGKKELGDWRFGEKGEGEYLSRLRTVDGRLKRMTWVLL